MKLVFGVGVNDSGYVTNPTIGGVRILCPYYKTWKGMLERGYCPKFKKKFPTYKSTVVCNEWLTFSNFKAWMETQDWEGKELDKDLLGDGSEYNPDVCVFVSHQTNCFLLDCGKLRG